MDKKQRKTKKNWRKNIDIEKVEDALESNRQEERITGSLETKKNEDLFVIDTKGYENILKGQKRLRIDEILQPQSKHQSLFTRKPVNEKRGLSKATLKLVNRKVQNGTREAPKKEAKSVSNLWDANADKPKIDHTNDMIADKVFHVKKVNIKPNEALKVKGALKVPYSGISYNPDETSHEQLINIAYEEELRKEKARVDDDKAVPLLVSNVEDEHDIKGLIDLIVQKPVVQKKQEGAQDDFQKEKDFIPLTTEQGTNKKTQKKKKNKKQRQKEIKAKLQKQKEQKTLEKQIQNIDSIKGNVNHQIKQQEKKTIQTKLKAKQKKVKTMKLSKHKFEAPSLEVSLKDELPDCLRKIKPEGNLFTDRFKSLQERNVVEARVPVTLKRKYKLKEYEKHSFKDFK